MKREAVLSPFFCVIESVYVLGLRIREPQRLVWC